MRSLTGLRVRRYSVGAYLYLSAVLGHAQAPDDSELAELEAIASPAVAAPAARTASIPLAALEIPVREANSRRPSDLFSAQSWRKPPPPPVIRPAPPPPPPTAPPLPFTFMGSFQQDEVTIYYLVRGDRAYDVKVGDVLDATYSVDGISDGQLVFTYLPLKQRQLLPLGTPRQ